MNWIFYALLAPLLYSLITMVDKYILEEEVPTYWGLPIYTAIVSVLFGITFWIIQDFQTLPFQDGLLLLLVGMSVLWGSVLYFIALSKEHSSIVIILLQIQPIFVLALSALFLTDTITLVQFAGFALILAAALGLSFKKQGGDHESWLSQAFWLMVAADLIWSVGTVLYKFVSASHPFLTTVVYENWGVGLGGLLVYLFNRNTRQGFHDLLRDNRRTLRLILFNEGLYTIAKIVSLLAVSLGPVALVSVLGGTEVFFGILLSGLLTLAFPTIFKEDISKAGLARKVGWAALMFVGVWLIST